MQRGCYLAHGYSSLCSGLGGGGAGARAQSLSVLAPLVRLQYGKPVSIAHGAAKLLRAYYLLFGMANIEMITTAWA